MSTISHIPKPIDNDPIRVIERLIRQVDCPNPHCDQTLDITSINEGTKIQCGTCKNVTWVPAYEPRWWQKAKVVIGGLLLSFAIGVLGSMTASVIISKYKASHHSIENKVQQTRQSPNSPNKSIDQTKD